MFADSLLDRPWTDRSRRGLKTLVSFAVQSVAVGGLLLIHFFTRKACRRCN